MAASLAGRSLMELPDTSPAVVAVRALLERVWQPELSAGAAVIDKD